MGQILHGCAVRLRQCVEQYKNSQENIKTLAARYSITPKTVVKWKKRITVHYAPMAPKSLHLRF